MKSTDRQFKEHPLYQGEDEQIQYVLTTTPWGSSPTSPTVTMYNEAGTDVTSTNVSGSASASGDEITTGTIKSLTSGTRYRMEIKFTCGSNVLEAWGYVYGQE